MATVAGGIHPPVSHMREYEAALRHTILNPFVRDTRSRLVEAQRVLRQISEVIDSFPAPQHPALIRQQAQGVTSAWAQRLQAYHRARLVRTMIRFFGVEVNLLSDAIIGPIVESGIRRAVDLIVTIPARYHASLKDAMLKLGRDRPFDEFAMRHVLARGYGSAGYNLRRLARDQTSKLVGDFTKARQEQLGITSYRWSTSLDERVRTSHRANEGLIFDWNHPPVGTGHPSEDVNCRCVALGVIKPTRAQPPVRQTPTRMKAAPTLPGQPPPAARPARLAPTSYARMVSDATKFLKGVDEADWLDALVTGRFGKGGMHQLADVEWDSLPGMPLFRRPDGRFSRTKAAADPDNPLVIKLVQGDVNRANVRVLTRQRDDLLNHIGDLRARVQGDAAAVADLDRVSAVVSDLRRYAALRGVEAVDDPALGLLLVNPRAGVVKRSAVRAKPKPAAPPKPKAADLRAIVKEADVPSSEVLIGRTTITAHSRKQIAALEKAVAASRFKGQIKIKVAATDPRLDDLLAGNRAMVHSLTPDDVMRLTDAQLDQVLAKHDIAWILDLPPDEFTLAPVRWGPVVRTLDDVKERWSDSKSWLAEAAPRDKRLLLANWQRRMHKGGAGLKDYGRRGFNPDLGGWVQDVANEKLVPPAKPTLEELARQLDQPGADRAAILRQVDETIGVQHVDRWSKIAVDDLIADNDRITREYNLGVDRFAREDVWLRAGFPEDGTKAWRQLADYLDNRRASLRVRIAEKIHGKSDWRKAGKRAKAARAEIEAVLTKLEADRDRLAELRLKYDHELTLAERNELSALRLARAKAVVKLNEIVRPHAPRADLAAKAAGFPGDPRMSAQPVAKATVERGIDAYSRMVSEKLAARIEVGFDTWVDRAHARKPTIRGGRATIAVEQQGTTGTVVHELGHTLEYQHTDLLREARDFLQKFTKDEISDVYPGEPGWKLVKRPGRLTTHISDRYTAKFYRAGSSQADEFVPEIHGRHVRATEVYAMGLQAMYENPLRFAQDQPEFFDFILRRVIYRD